MRQNVNPILARAKNYNLIYSFICHCKACDDLSHEEDIQRTLDILVRDNPEWFYDNPSKKRRN
jgi:hypothetical protein